MLLSLILHISVPNIATICLHMLSKNLLSLVDIIDGINGRNLIALIIHDLPLLPHDLRPDHILLLELVILDLVGSTDTDAQILDRIFTVQLPHALIIVGLVWQEV